MSRHIYTEVPQSIAIESFISLFRQQYRDILPGTNLDGEAHAFWEFFALEKGSANVLVDGELFHLEEGQLIFYPPHAFHSLSSSHDAIINVISFETNSRMLFSYANDVHTLSEKLQTSLSDIMRQGAGVLPKLRYEKSYALSRLAKLVEIFLIELCEEGAEEAPPQSPESYQNEAFEMLTAYLKKNICVSISVKDICSTLNISESTLHRLCKRYCGCGAITYFIALKLGRAKRLLSENTLNVTQIAELLGFSSVHYFSKQFKEKTGMSPMQYANAFKELQSNKTASDY